MVHEKCLLGECDCHEDIVSYRFSNFYFNIFVASHDYPSCTMCVHMTLCLHDPV